MGKREEISDLVTDKAFQDLKKGDLLKFQKATIKITKIDRKNKRMWGEHVEVFSEFNVRSHTGHDVDLKPATPFCRDCDAPVSEHSTEDGDKKALDRRDDEERHILQDGTRV